MSPYRRNVIVGITVLVSMITLGWMILRFGGGMASPFAAKQMAVTFTTDRADGISEGSAITYKGIEAGRVIKTTLSEDQRGVVIDALINEKPVLPGNVRGVIRTVSALGSGAAIILEVDGNQPSGTLQSGQTVPTRYIGFDFIPSEFAEAATELRQTVKQFRDSKLIEDLDTEVKRAGQLTDALQKYVDDPKMRDDIKQTLSNMRSATETASKVATKLDKLTDDASGTLGQAKTSIAKSEEQITTLSQQVSARLDQTGKLLEQFHSIAGKIDKGEGTAGQLVNDRRLYEGLVDTSSELNATVKDLKRLIEQWEQEGASIKLK